MAHMTLISRAHVGSLPKNFKRQPVQIKQSVMESH